jgi:hypothetical protein
MPDAGPARAGIYPDRFLDDGVEDRRSWWAITLLSG